MREPKSGAERLHKLERNPYSCQYCIFRGSCHLWVYHRYAFWYKVCWFVMVGNAHINTQLKQLRHFVFT